jgi:hypothetical protein
MKISNLYNRVSAFFVLLSLVAALSACTSQSPTASVPPQAPVPLSGAVALAPTATSNQVWDVRDDEVVWGSASEIAEEESEGDAELLEEADDEGGGSYTDEATVSAGNFAAPASTEESEIPDSEESVTATHPRQALPPSYIRAVPPSLTQPSDDPSATTRSESSLSSSASAPSAPSVREPSYTSGSTPPVAENGSYYGEISPATGRPKTLHVEGYYRKDGTYVRGHYRGAPRRRN